MKRFLILATSGAALMLALAGSAHAAYFHPYMDSYNSGYGSSYDGQYNSSYGPSFGYSFSPYNNYDRSYQYVPNTARVIHEDDSTRTVIRTYFDRNGRPLYDKVATTSTQVVPHAQSSYIPSRGYYNMHNPYASNPWMYSNSNYNSYNPGMYSSGSYWGY